MSLFRDNYRSLTLGQTYYYRVIAKNESGQSAPSNVIRLKHMQKNLPPVITLQDMLSTTVDKGVQLNAAWQDDNLPGPKVSVAWSHDGKNNVHLAEIGIAMDIQSEGPVLADGVIDDTFRIELMEEHLEQLHRAISEGANCFGVHQWTFIDNWSWINSFKRRYGFWRLDLESGERQIKRNALWFAQLAASNGFTPGAFIKGNK
ncbi:TPA: family 1 glycosylhydrolase [Klebsiella aerogenes]